jgi:protein-tyrosine phosphatase
VFGIFKTKVKSATQQPLKVDLHSHLLPGLDDGVKSFDESLQVLRRFVSFGISRVITTPHIMSDVYRNSAATIIPKLEELRKVAADENLPVRIDAAAEYYLDEGLMKALRENERLLKINDEYLLFETNFLSEPLYLRDFIFEAMTKGHKLILAHPERYVYLQQDFSKAEDLLNRGVLLQLNLSSLNGHYSKPAQKLAEKLIDRGWVHWLATDCHQPQQLDILAHAMQTKNFEKAVHLPLLNNTLI